jgi:ectoine hydroxylase-related dioxygenase (phytanoyl-CoA dioxygenase family)
MQLHGALDERQRTAYRQDGYHFPVRAFSEEDAAALRQRFLDYWQSHQEALMALKPRERAAYLLDTHLFLRWVSDMALHPRVLDAVESVLGPDLLVWSTQWFTKLAHDKAYVSWHQDATYWGLSPPNVTTAWIALTESTLENGCLRVIPTSQRQMLPQRETYAETNMLSRGQEIAVDVEENHAVDLTLRPGEFSLHHVGIVHGSGPNESQGPRIGLAVRFISPDVVQSGAQRDLAVLARGQDRYGHFDLAQPPARDMEFGQSAAHADSLARKKINLYKK